MCPFYYSALVLALDVFCNRSILAYFATSILAYGALWPSHADAQSEESIARFCGGIAYVWAMRGEEYVPKFEGNSPAQRGVDSYWRHSFREVSVPIPMDTDGWGFWFDDSKHVKNLVGMAHDRLDISYSFVTSQVPMIISGVGQLAAEFGLPSADLEPMELVRLALTIDPEEVMCDPNDVQETVNNLSAVHVKSLLLSHHDKAYLHEGGVLGHSVVKIGESWTYLFEDDSGQWFEIKISHEKPGHYPYIGFEIDEKVLMDSMYSPPWMPLFFETASDPTRDRLVRLRDFIIDYPLPEETYRMLDAKIAQYE